MPDRFFTQGEAEALKGALVRTQVDFSGVPKGTGGVVTRADESAEGYIVAIEWALPDRTKPLTDWFSKAEFEQYLTRQPPAPLSSPPIYRR